MVHPARPARFERATNGLEGRGVACDSEGLTGQSDQQGTNAAADPVEVLRALARGDAEAARAGGRELAQGVMEGRLVQLARAVLEGGTFVDSRVAELCDALLEERAATAARRTG